MKKALRNTLYAVQLCVGLGGLCYLFGSLWFLSLGFLGKGVALILVAHAIKFGRKTLKLEIKEE